MERYGPGRCLELTDLPDSCLVNIFEKCMAKDVLVIQVTCSRFLALGRLTLLWENRLSKEFGVKVELDANEDKYEVYQRIYWGLANGQATRLRFVGVLTDGGVQDNRDNLWVDNMFEYGVHRYYCSDRALRDVRCIGLFSPTPHRTLINRKTISLPHVPTSDSQDRPNVSDNMTCMGMGGVEADARGTETDKAGNVNECDSRDVMYNESYMSFLRERLDSSNDHKLKRSLVMARKIRIGRMGMVTCPVACGVVFLGNVEVSNENDLSVEQNVAKLYGSTQSKAMSMYSKFVDLESILGACKQGGIRPPRLVAWGKKGEWVEFESNDTDREAFQPVIWFRFYTRLEYVGRSCHQEELRRSYFIDEFSKLGTKCADNTIPTSYPIHVNKTLTALMHGEALNLFSDEEHSFSDSSEEAGTHQDAQSDGHEPPDDNSDWEFDDPHDLQWLTIDLEGGPQHYLSKRCMVGRDYMEVPLVKPASGKGLCVMLNACENLMHEAFGDIDEEPNVDVNCVWLDGHVIHY